MPIYEYQCNACGHRLEKLQKISDAPLTDCPSCSRPELDKLVSAAAFRLKGSGWYETDFKTGGKKNLLQGTDSGSDASSTSASNDSTGSDKKSADSGSDNSNGNSKSDVSAAAS